MSLSDDQVRRIARLARIDLPAGASGEVLERLNRVLGLVEALRAVDTSGIAPMAHPLEEHIPGGQRLRADVPTEKDQRALYQSVAPAVAEGLYLVPKVIE